MTSLLLLVLSLPGSQEMAWMDDYPAALKRGRAEARLILVHFQAPGRPLSDEMQKVTFSDSGVIRMASARFVSVRLDGEATTDLMQRLSGSRGGLASCIVDGTEDVVSALPGFADAETFHRFLERAARGYRVLQAARKAAAKRPGRAPLLFALGEEYAALESRRMAESCFEAATLGVAVGRSENRAVAFSHERLARMNALRGRNVQAREQLEAFRGCDTGGREDRAKVTEALACALERKPLEAIGILAAALKRYSRSPERDQMVLLTGICLHDAGREEEALATLEGMVRDFPRSPWLGRARTRIEHIKNPPPGHDHKGKE